jgi:large conductance mechanosensitive channel
LTPLIAAIVKTPDFSGLFFMINGSKFMYGHFINALISFVLVSSSIFFFVVKPMNLLISLSHKELPANPTTKKCPECLSEIPKDAKRCSHCTQVVL